MGSEMQRLPDILTASRGFIALAMVALGFVGPEALRIVVVLTMIGWTTDIFDGRVARHIQKPSTWIGEHDFMFDMLMVLGSVFYLVIARFVPFTVAAIYIAVASVFIVIFRSKMVTMTFAVVWVAAPLYFAFLHDRRIGFWFLGWIVLALLLDWKRFKGVVLEFIENARQLAKR